VESALREDSISAIKEIRILNKENILTQFAMKMRHRPYRSILPGNVQKITLTRNTLLHSALKRSSIAVKTIMISKVSTTVLTKISV
jgi:hypothetical protein